MLFLSKERELTGGKEVEEHFVLPEESAVLGPML
jgi:hypothetical protein